MPNHQFNFWALQGSQYWLPLEAHVHFLTFCAHKHFFKEGNLSLLDEFGSSWDDISTRGHGNGCSNLLFYRWVVSCPVLWQNWCKDKIQWLKHWNEFLQKVSPLVPITHNSNHRRDGGQKRAAQLWCWFMYMWCIVKHPLNTWLPVDPIGMMVECKVQRPPFPLSVQDVNFYCILRAKPKWHSWLGWQSRI